MKYNFDKEIDRNNTNSLKWDLYPNTLPMWVADMDFEVADEITGAITNSVNHKIYGYSIISDKWYKSYVNWWKKRHHIQLDKDYLLFSTGVMPTISSIIRQFTTVGDNVLIQTPVYHAFSHVINNNQRVVLENELEYDGNAYLIDYDDLENKLKMVDLMILCNPHNPIGRIWSEDELTKILQLCNKYDVILISDEIHCDLVNPGLEYVPILSLDESLTKNVIMCMSPTKTFNIAGIQSSAVYIHNDELYDIIKKRLQIDQYSMPNVFAIDSVIAAFEYGESWLDELNEYIYQNKKIVEDYLENEISHLKLIKSEATYLLWIDCNNLSYSDNFCEILQNEYSLYVSPGKQFGKCGEGFIRLNIACPKDVLIQGLTIIKEAINKYDDNA